MFLISCNTVYEQKTEFNEQAWNYKDSVVFEADIDKIDIPYNVFIDINNREEYKYSNIYLFISLKSPDNKVITDTVDVMLADYKGKWYGNEKGDDYEGHYLFKRTVLFPTKGTYTFSIKQGMRDDIIKGISSVGVSIEEYKE
jgi:gliding motility-associated lipoprotein GldH